MQLDTTQNNHLNVFCSNAKAQQISAVLELSVRELKGRTVDA